MIDGGKKNVLGVLVDAVDYEVAVHRVISAAEDGRPYGVTALAVHGVMTGVQDPIHAFRLNEMAIVVPDGQPVRWALNLLHSAGLKDRVYGPELTLRVCAAAADVGLPVYFYGSKGRVLGSLIERLRGRFPSLEIAGFDPSLFRRTSPEEKDAIVRRIRESGARITFVGLGCPRQEVWAYEYRKELSMPVIAVGAAFDFHAGTLPQRPAPHAAARAGVAVPARERTPEVVEAIPFFEPLLLLAAGLAGHAPLETRSRKGPSARTRAPVWLDVTGHDRVAPSPPAGVVSSRSFTLVS